MNQEKMNKQLKKRGKVFQIIGITKNFQNVYYVFATRKDAEKFIEKQDFLQQHQLIDIDVWGMKK